MSEDEGRSRTSTPADGDDVVSRWTPGDPVYRDAQHPTAAALGLPDDGSDPILAAYGRGYAQAMCDVRGEPYPWTAQEPVTPRPARPQRHPSMGEALLVDLRRLLHRRGDS